MPALRGINPDVIPINRWPSNNFVKSFACHPEDFNHANVISGAGKTYLAVSINACHPEAGVARRGTSHTLEPLPRQPWRLRQIDRRNSLG